MLRRLFPASRSLTARYRHALPPFAAVTRPCTTAPPLPSPSSPSPPAATPPSANELDGGRCLARLSKLALALQDAIDSEEIGAEQMPELLFDLEQDVHAALDLVRTALDKAGRPCTVDELADRTVHNIVPIPAHALDFKQYLDAAALRDQIEGALGNLDVMPPADAQLDGTGLPFSRKDRKKELRRRRREAAGLPPDPDDEPVVDEDDDDAESRFVVAREGEELTELRPITVEQLKRRKEFLEQSTSIEAVLRGYDTALLEVGRVHKVVKGGTTMSMRALVVIGNRKGVAGYGEGKSDTVQHAIERACRDAKRNMLPLDLFQGRTIYHRTSGKFVKSRVSLWPAPQGTGISANNNFNAIFQLFGIKDIGAKLHGPRSLINAVKALFNALSNMETPQSVAARRGLEKLPPNPALHKLGIPPKKIRAV